MYKQTVRPKSTVMYVFIKEILVWDFDSVYGHNNLVETEDFIRKKFN